MDAPPDGSPTVDTDGDGIVDASDDCPTIANTDQRDWDGDGHGDVCDHCPHLASPADPDTDGDGVGDACDPRPATGGDTRVLWDGFYDANAITGWTEGGTGGAGTWTVTGGKLVQSATDPLNFASFYAPGTWQKTYVATSFVVGSWNTGATLGVCSGWDGNHFDCCNVNDATFDRSSVGEAQRDLAQKGRHRATDDRDRADVRCRAGSDDDERVLVQHVRDGERATVRAGRARDRLCRAFVGELSLLVRRDDRVLNTK